MLQGVYVVHNNIQILRALQFTSIPSNFQHWVPKTESSFLPEELISYKKSMPSRPLQVWAEL